MRASPKDDEKPLRDSLSRVDEIGSETHLNKRSRTEKVNIFLLSIKFSNECLKTCREYVL